MPAKKTPTQNNVRSAPDTQSYQQRMSLPVSYQSLDCGGRIVDVNQKWCDTLGYRREEAVGRWFGDFLAPDSVPLFREKFPLLVAAGEIHNAELELLRKDGGRLTVLFDGRVERDGRGAFKRTHCIFHDITDRARLQKLIEQSEGRYRELFDHMSSGVAVYEVRADGEDFVFADFNRAAERIESLDRQEVIGKSVLDVFPGIREFGLFDVFQRVWRTGIPEHYPVCHYQDKRIAGWRENYVYRLPSGEIVAVYDDITERKQIEEAVLESEGRYRDLFENANDIIYTHDLEGTVLSFNKTAEKLTGYSRSDVIGKNIFAILTPKDQQLARSKVLEKLNTMELTVYDVEVICKDGRKMPVEVSSRLILRDGKPIGVQGIARDVTARKQAELQLRKSLEGTIRALGQTTETRDPYTAGHQKRVTELSCAIAEKISLSEDRIDAIRVAGEMHDIGKLAVPAEILAKPGTLTDTEYALLKTHPQVAYNILESIDFPWPVAQIVLQHHERLDGTGYPQSLKGETILLEARILAVADVVEAMASHRPYRPALGIDKALEEIAAQKGTVYDPDVVDACIHLFRSGEFRFSN